jgi:pantothenate synthetase
MRIQKLAESGERTAAKLVAAGREEFAQDTSVRLDYLELVHPDTLDPVSDISGGVLAAVAAFVGSTRLIDNLLLPGKSGSP